MPHPWSVPDVAPFSLFLEWVNDLPIVLHVYNGPAFRRGLVERLVEMADGGLAVVGPFTLGIGVVHDECEAGTAPPSCPLEHLLVAVRVAESSDGTAADVLVNADGLA